jgi:hypothetical protein
MRKFVRLISILLAIVYLMVIPLSSYAAAGTSGSSYAGSLLNKWKGYGILDKSYTASDLGKPIQRIDFISLINGILKPSKQVDIGFSDVPKDSWYGQEIAKAVASGYVENKDKVNFYPFTEITRKDAAVMAAHVFALKLSNTKLLSQVKDAQNLDDKELENFCAVIEEGGLSAISEGRFVPSGVLKLSDALIMLDKCVGQLILKAGNVTQGGSGNIVVGIGNVVLKNLTIGGNLTIGEGAANGDVKLEGVTVQGKLIIRGGGPNSISIKNSQINDDVIVENSAGNVHVLVQGNTSIEQTALQSGCVLEEGYLSGGGKGFVNINAERAAINNQTANLKGEFSRITLDESNINIKLYGKAGSVNISNETKSDFSLVSGQINTITTNSSKNVLDFSGGTVTNLNIEEDAKGNKITIDGNASISNMDINDITTINFIKGNVDKVILEPTSKDSYLSMVNGSNIKSIEVRAPATITGFGKIGDAYIFANNVKMDVRPTGVFIANGLDTDVSGGNSDPLLSTVEIVVPDELTVQEGQTKAINAAARPEQSTLMYISSDNKIATVSDSGEITGMSGGVTHVHVTGAYPGYNTGVMDIEVTVTSGNVTIPGTLDISPDTGEAGTTKSLELTYTAVDNFSNGTLILRLPDGFPVYETDSVIIANGAEATLTKSQRLNVKTLSFTNLNIIKGQTIVVKLKNKNIPAGGRYSFTAVSDADGTGPKLPTSGEDETAVFTSDKLRVLLPVSNYSVPENGSQGGTIKISKLLFVGCVGATKWLINVQDGAFTVPAYDTVITGDEYKQGDDIAVEANKHLMLAAVDADNKLKGFADIVVDGNWIRPYDASALIQGTNYNAVSGIEANAVRITGLKLDGLDPAAEKWMVRIQNAPEASIFVNTLFNGQPYTDGDDLSVYAGQHIILAAVDKDSKIKAYADIPTDNTLISSPAILLTSANYVGPSCGTVEGTTKIDALTKDTLNIEKWMVVPVSKTASTVPGLNTPAADFERYTGGDQLKEYSSPDNIIAADDQKLLLVGVSGDTNKIQAYVYLNLEGKIRKADAPEIPAGNIGALEMGTETSSVRISSLSLTAPDTITGAVKFMINVQNAELTSPQIDSTLAGARDYQAKDNIKVTLGDIIVLIATDKDGHIKAYKNIKVDDATKIRPEDAPVMTSPNDFTLVPGSDVSSTSILISSSYTKWAYKLQGSQFEVPYKGSVISDAIPYTPGANIPSVYLGEHILLLAIGSSGETLAYADILINSTNQIRQPMALELKSNSEDPVKYNYTVPVTGDRGGQTKITNLSNFGLQYPNGIWMYAVVNSNVPRPEYNSTMNFDGAYSPQQNINISEGQYLVLCYTDSSHIIKAFACMQITKDQIRTPDAVMLKTPTNYKVEQGTTAETTRLTSLTFGTLTGDPTGWKWMYALGNASYPIPEKGLAVSKLNGVNVYGGENIPVTAGKYILLLAVDGSNLIQGYANIQIRSGDIKPVDADLITGYTLEKGAAEGTTRFSSLDSITGATQWRYYIQSGALTAPIGKDTTAASNARRYDFALSPKPDIPVSANEHIILLATDSSGLVKAYADIQVNSNVIQTPFAVALQAADYSGPRAGSTAGTTQLILRDTNVPKTGTDTVVWGYKTDVQKFAVPHLDDDASVYIATASGDDIPVQPENWLLIVASVNGRVKAYMQVQVHEDAIKAKEAPELIEGINDNYTLPVPGSQPGTTKLAHLDRIGLENFAGWVYKISKTAEPILEGSYLGIGSQVSSIDNIKVAKGDYIVLAAVDSAGKVIAYKNIQITDDSQITPVGFTNNYSGPDMGTVHGTTSFAVSLNNNLGSAVGFVAKVADAGESLATGQVISLGTGTGTDFSNYRVYNSRDNIAIKPNQTVVLIAVDNANKVVAYQNIKVPETSINPGDAVLLMKDNGSHTGNYSELSLGSIAGTVKFTYLDKLGAGDINAVKWVVRVVNDPISAPLMNTVIDNPPAVGYSAGTNIDVSKGKYLVLYAVESASNAIKGYACMQVRPDDLVVKSMPVPGTGFYTTSINTSDVMLPADTVLKYLVRSSSIGLVLKDSIISELNTYSTPDITADAGNYLLLAAADSQGRIKAYKEIQIIYDMLNVPNTLAGLSGTLVSGPVTRNDIVTGNKTLIITLTDGKWASDVATNATKRNALIDGLKLFGTTESAQWGYVITAIKNAGQAAVLRTDDKTVTIKLPSVSNYNITRNQTVTLTIPAACIAGAIADVAVAQNITIESVGTAALSIKGTVAYTESDIRTGGKTLVVTLSNAVWVDDIDTNASVKTVLLNGLKATTETDQWAKVLAKAGDASITKGTTAGIINIILPAAADYDIAANQAIALTIPSSAINGMSFDVKATGTVTISSVVPPVIPAAIQSVSGADTGKSYKVDDTVNINVKFDKPVTVTGTPTIALQLGTASRNASYVSGSGTDTLLFTYKVQAGDSSQMLEYKAGSVSGTIVNEGTTTAVTKTLPVIGGGFSLGESNLVIDGVVPQFASTYPKLGTRVAADEADILVKLNDTAKIYYVVVPYSVGYTSPTTDQIKDGTAASAVSNGAFEVVASNTEYPVAITGLTDNKGYLVYMYAEDNSGNKGTIVSMKADIKPPVVNTIQLLTQEDNAISILVNVNEPGSIYMIALPDGSPEPTNAQVKASASKVKAVVSDADVNKDITMKVSGLDVSTEYDIYIVCEDTANPLNLSAPVKQDARTAQLDLSKVDVDLSLSRIINTNGLMEYSLNGNQWFGCGSGTTNFVYDPNAGYVTVYIREAKDTSNITNPPITLSAGDDSILNRAMIEYDVAKGTITNNSAINLLFRIDGGAWVPLAAGGTVTTVFKPGPLDLRTAATPPTAAGRDSKLPSLPRNIDNIPDPGSAPNLVYDDDTNTIKGLNDTYEYSINNGASWTSGDVEGDFAGTKTVLIMLKATATRLPSEAQEINFTANVIKVVALPAVGTQKATVTVTFEENTNKAGQTLTAQQIKDWFTVGSALGDTHEWGTDIQGKFNSTGNVLTITFNSMDGSTVKIGDTVSVSAIADIQNSAGNSGAYTSTGKLGGSFHTVPRVLSIKAENTNNDIGFSNGEQLVITFDQATSTPAIDTSNIANYLKLTDDTGKTLKKWYKTNPSSLSIAWTGTGDNELTITFNNISDTELAVGDKITVNTGWELTDKDGTTDYCNSARIIEGSFTSTPEVTSVVMANGGTAGKVDAGDTVTITFDQATNIPQIAGTLLNTYLKLVSSDGKTAHSWGTQSNTNIKWVDGKTLTIKLSNMVGVTVTKGDRLTISPSAGIKAADGGTDSCEAVGLIIGGSY